MNSLLNQQRNAALEEIASWGYFRSVRWVDSIDSTNLFLSQQVREGMIEVPTLLVADSQTGGVGRGANKWYSPSGCLMFSMAIPLDEHDSTLLPLHFGFAVAHAIEPMSREKPLIKWPNDVFIDGKKICGILIEAIPMPTKCGASNRNIAVIGVGLNCQVDLSTAPEQLRSSATSLHAEAKPAVVSRITPEYVLIQVLQSWMALNLRSHEAPYWLTDVWPEVSLLHQQWVTVRTANGIVEGCCLGINNRGALRIATPDHRVIEVISGSIESYRR